MEENRIGNLIDLLLKIADEIKGTEFDENGEADDLKEKARKLANRAMFVVYQSDDPKAR